MFRVLLTALFLSFILKSQEAGPPATVEQMFQRAVDAQQSGDFEAAVRAYRALLQRDPGLTDARANLAAALVHLGRFDEAIAEYQSALKQDPSNDAIRLNLSLAFYKKGDYKTASQELERLYGKDPANARIATLLADCYSRLGNDPKAISILEPIESKHPGDLDLEYVLGSALVRGGKSSQGVPLLEHVASQGKSADAYLLAGGALLKMDERDRALADLQTAVQLNPNLPGVYTQLGIAKEASGDTAGAEEDLRKAIQQKPNDFEATVHLGGVLYSRRDLDNARIYIEKALSLRPDSTFAKYEMALLKSATGQVEAAVSDLETIEHSDPNWLDPHVRLAALYYKVNRPADGQRERDIVDKLTAEQQKQGPTPPPR